MYIVQASAAGEGAGFWRSVMAELTNRGVRDIRITRCDGLAGFENTIASAFPQTLPRCVVHDAGRSHLATVQGSLARKCLARGVPANFSPSKREMSSTELRGRWLTTTCWACPAALLVTVTTTLVGSPRTCAV